MKDSILDRAVCMATGKRLTARRDRMVQMKVKRMAADRIMPDRDGEPSSVIKGKLIRTYSYGGRDATAIIVGEHENGVLLRIAGRSKPEWFFKPRADEAFQKARLIRDYVKAVGKMEIPSERELEKTSGRAFEEAARRIAPDSKRLPTAKAMGYLMKEYSYGTGENRIKVSEYANGVAIRYNNTIEWFGKDRKREGFDKARYLSSAQKTKQIFA